jgi:OmpA-OmpF porin, OOP family
MNNNTRMLALVACVVVAAAVAFGVARATGVGSEDSCTPSGAEARLSGYRLEGDPWTGYAAFRDPTFMRSSGLTYSYADQLDQAVRACNLTSGKTEFLVTTIDQYLTHRPDGKIVAVIDQSAGADALVLDSVRHKYLRTLDWLPQLVRELRGQGRKPVLAYTGNSPSDFLLTQIANSSEDLSLADFDLVSVDQSATAFEKLKRREADVAVLWEPDVSAARAAGYTVAASSRDFPDAIVDVLVASNRLIQRQDVAVQKVVDAFYASRSAAAADPVRYEAAIAKDGKLTAEQTKNVLNGIRFYSAREADRYMNTKEWPLAQTRLEESLEAVGAILSLKDPSIKPTNQMWDGRFVQAVP